MTLDPDLILVFPLLIGATGIIYACLIKLFDEGG